MEYAFTLAEHALEKTCPSLMFPFSWACLAIVGVGTVWIGILVVVLVIVTVPTACLLDPFGGHICSHEAMQRPDRPWITIAHIVFTPILIGLSLMAIVIFVLPDVPPLAQAKEPVVVKVQHVDVKSQ